MTEGDADLLCKNLLFVFHVSQKDADSISVTFSGSFSDYVDQNVLMVQRGCLVLADLETLLKALETTLFCRQFI